VKGAGPLGAQYTESLSLQSIIWPLTIIAGSQRPFANKAMCWKTKIVTIRYFPYLYPDQMS